LRAATRAAGVSPNAAYRHFADRDELLGTVRALCLERLSDLMKARLAETPAGPDPVASAWQRLRVAGRAYVEFAVTEPGWFRTAFGAARPEGPATMPDQGNPLALLNAILDDLVAVGALPAERRPGAEYAAWSAVHGVATLLVDGPFAGLPATDQTQIVNKVIEVFLAGLRACD
jgi:AcrR family transcriptional regulator